MIANRDPACHEATGLFDVDGNVLFEGDVVVNLNCIYTEEERAAARRGDIDEISEDAIGPVLFCEDSTGKPGYWSACGTGIWLMPDDPTYGVKLIRRAS